MRKIPLGYAIAIAALLLVAVFALLVQFGVPPFDTTLVFLLGNFAGAMTMVVFGVLGGAFAGMLLAHRMLASRQFSPFERQVLESLAEIRERLDRLEKERGPPR